MKKTDKPQLSEEQIAGIIDRALAEDISHGDVTSEAIIPLDLHAKATVLVKAAGVLAGIEVARKVFRDADGAGEAAVPAGRHRPPPDEAVCGGVPAGLPPR